MVQGFGLAMSRARLQLLSVLVLALNNLFFVSLNKFSHFFCLFRGFFLFASNSTARLNSFIGGNLFGLFVLGGLLTSDPFFRCTSVRGFSVVADFGLSLWRELRINMLFLIVGRLNGLLDIFVRGGSKSLGDLFVCIFN